MYRGASSKSTNQTRRLMILLPPHPRPSARCLSFSVFLCVAHPAYTDGRRRSQVIRRRESLVIYTMKGTGSRDFFASGCFSVIIFFQAPENSIRVTSNLFENSRRYLQVKVHTGGKFATGVNDTGGPWAANISANFRSQTAPKEAGFLCVQNSSCSHF